MLSPDQAASVFSSWAPVGATVQSSHPRLESVMVSISFVASCKLGEGQRNECSFSIKAVNFKFREGRCKFVPYSLKIRESNRYFGLSH